MTFASLARACVPEFADGCDVELSAGTEPVFRITHPARPADGPAHGAAQPVVSGHTLMTPFRVVSHTGCPSYAGVVTHWWNGRAPSEGDAVIADLMVRHLSALVAQERLRGAVARAEDRAASLALESIAARTVNIATGVVMRQKRLTADAAERLLRQSARIGGTGLAQLASAVVRGGALRDSGALPESAGSAARLGAAERDLALIPADARVAQAAALSRRAPVS